MAHDFAAQQAETTVVFDKLQAEHGLPDVADIDYFFVPAQGTRDWQPLAEALSNVGFSCEFFTADDPEVTSYLLAVLPDQIVSATGIWIGEEIATRLALDYGFLPDGWGMQGEG